MPLVLIGLLTACTKSNNGEQALQNQIDSLKTKLENAYKPGFGDFMGKVQTRHSKLWFAGVNENWELAQFATYSINQKNNTIKNKLWKKLSSQR